MVADFVARVRGSGGRLPVMGELMSGWIIGCHACMCAQLLQSFPALCNPMDGSPPNSSVHEISQARILEWIAMPSSRGSSQPRSWACICCVSCIAAGFFTIEPLGKPISYHGNQQRETLLIIPLTNIVEGSDLKLEQSLAGPWDKHIGRLVTWGGVSEAGTGQAEDVQRKREQPSRVAWPHRCLG